MPGGNFCVIARLGHLVSSHSSWSPDWKHWMLRGCYPCLEFLILDVWGDCWPPSSPCCNSWSPDLCGNRVDCITETEAWKMSEMFTRADEVISFSQMCDSWCQRKCLIKNLKYSFATPGILKLVHAWNDGVAMRRLCDHRLVCCYLQVVSLFCCVLKIRLSDLMILSESIDKGRSPTTHTWFHCLFALFRRAVKSPPLHLTHTPKMELSLQKQKFTGGFSVTDCKDCKALWVPLSFSTFFLCRRALGID